MKSATILKPLPTAGCHSNRSLLVAAVLVGLTLANAQATLLFSDTFDYPDGSLTANSGGAWTTNSGTADQMQVIGSSAQITRSQSEDVARSLGATYSSGTLFYSALITMTEVPLLSQYGGYVMHLSDTEGGIDTDFFARLYVNRVDTSDQFVFGVRNRSLLTSPSDYPTVFASDQPIDLNTQVAVVVRLDLETKQSTLWVNPENSGSPSVTDTFEVSFSGLDQTLSRLSMRQASGIGTMLVDEVRVGTTFDDVLLVAVPEPGVVSLVLLGLLATGIVVRKKIQNGFSGSTLSGTAPAKG